MFKNALKVILVLVLLMVVGWVVKVVFFPAHVVSKGIDTAYQITDKTLDADNVIANYEWFKQQYEDYLTIQSKIQQSQSSVDNFTSTAGDREKWTFEDKTEYSRLTSIVDGLKYQAEDIKAEYNAKSKMINRSIFKDNKLPSELN